MYRSHAIVVNQILQNFKPFLKMGFCLFSVIFHYRKDKQLYGYLLSINEVLSFPLIPPVTNNSKLKCAQMTKISLVFSLSPH